MMTVLFILFAALTRIIPHPWNFTAISAMALFSGNKNKNLLTAILLPWISLFLTDLYLGFHSTMIYVYVSVAMITYLAQKNQMRKNQDYLVNSVISSLIFFLVTNFGVWYSTGFYTLDLKGLTECFILAIPFFKNQIFGDLFYTGLLFFAFHFVSIKIEHKSQI